MTHDPQPAEPGLTVGGSLVRLGGFLVGALSRSPWAAGRPRPARATLGNPADAIFRNGGRRSMLAVRKVGKRLPEPVHMGVHR